MSFELEQEPLEEAAQRAAELFVEIFAGLEDRRVDPGVDHDELTDRFEGTLTDEGTGLLRTLDEFRSQVLPASMGTPHPLYLGLVNSSPFPAAALADLLVSSLNNNGGAFHQSPAMSAAEREVIRVFARLFGFAEPASGMLLPGGTFATLQALALARARYFPDWQELGLEPIESSIRDQVGIIVSPDRLFEVPARVHELMASGKEWVGRMRELREQLVFRLGHSVADGAAEIARLADRQRALRLELDQDRAHG